MSIRRLTAAAFLAFTALVAPATSQQASDPVERTYAIRSNGRVIGYQIETETAGVLDGRPVTNLIAKSLVKIEMLGQSFEQRVDQTWTLEPATRRVLAVESALAAGPQRIECNGKLLPTGFALDASVTLDPETVVISPDFRWLADRGPTDMETPIEIQWFMPEMGSAQRAKVTYIAEREVTVQGIATAAREYEIDVVDLGSKFLFTVDRTSFEMLRCEIPALQMVVERAAPTMVERIERVDLTNVIVGKSNLDYDDPSKLTFMRVRAKITTSDAVTKDGLDVPGQSFAGSVTDGVVDGVFEIRPRRIDGTGAPAFPVAEDTFAAAELQPYLAPEENIESDDPGIAQKARELAEGATNCFEVLDRLSRWTGEIPYVIPGGGSAKRTFELRAGECGGHSRVLAAMLRSLGIPARTPMGAMFVPLYGGSFGQHMWTEVWLGHAIGWLPVDCTAGQWTYIDASHIRLSEHLTAFRPQSLEVLDHEPKQAAAADVARRTDAFPWAIGAVQTFVYRRGDKVLGEEQMTYRGKTDDGGHLFESSIALAGGRFEEEATTVVGDDGRLVRFHAERHAGGDTTFDARVENGVATISYASADEDGRHPVEVAADSFVLHNNNTAHFAIALSRLQFSDGVRLRTSPLHIEHHSPLPMTLRMTGEERITIGNEQVNAHIVEISLVGTAITAHLDDTGRLLRYHQPAADVTIELQQR